MKHFIATKDFMPPQHIIVETKVVDEKGERNNAFLIRKGDLWFTEDEKMYVYYVPTHWRYCN